MSEISRIDVLDDGPLVAQELNKLDNSKGEELEVKKKTALCRCGASENKPYCDGSHKRIGFSNRVNKAIQTPAPGAEYAGEIDVLKNGPYQVKGCVLDTAAAENLSADKPYYLCRCGASGNKPFCDGTHKTIKFDDEKN